MNIEKQIQYLLSDDYSKIDAGNFLDKLHATRERKIRNRQRFSNTVSSLIVVFLVGVLAITQLNNTASDAQYFQYLADANITEEMVEEYYDELAVYLVQQSDDIWTTMEFFYKVNNQSINN
ncbi:MAG: hypothetical protein V3R52_02180 [Candidatus Neomarinimicrobiota bacterium]